MLIMTNKTDEEIYEYVRGFKENLRDEYNKDQENLFESSNKVKLQLSSQQIVFCSLLISIGSGYLLSNPTADLDVKILLIVALYVFTGSVVFGLYGIYLASEFWLKWARHAHEKGGMVNKDKSKTAEELDVLLDNINKKNSAMPESSSKISTIIQSVLFIVGLLLILIALSVVAYR